MKKPKIVYKREPNYDSRGDISAEGTIGPYSFIIHGSLNAIEGTHFTVIINLSQPGPWIERSKWVTLADVFTYSIHNESRTAYCIGDAVKAVKKARKALHDNNYQSNIQK